MHYKNGQFIVTRDGIRPIFRRGSVPELCAGDLLTVSGPHRTYACFAQMAARGDVDFDLFADAFVHALSLSDQLGLVDRAILAKSVSRGRTIVALRRSNCVFSLPS